MMTRLRRTETLSCTLLIALACTTARPQENVPVVAAVARDTATRAERTAAAARTPAQAAAFQTISLLGDTLRTPPLAGATRADFEQRLAEARAEFDASGGSADAWIWLGRRTAYLGRYREAVAIYTDAIRAHPEDARILRHRGHRYITLRQLDSAIADLLTAAELTVGQPDEVEPDGLPNERNIPTSSVQSNIWYHLALAYYLRGDFDPAVSAFREAARVSPGPDNLVASTHWLYAALRRAGRREQAAEVIQPVTADMDIIENGSYHRLVLMYRGELHVDSLLPQGAQPAATPSDAAVAYGVAAWYLYNADTTRAESIMRAILRSPQWASFGYIAAEADCARLLRRGRSCR